MKINSEFLTGEQVIALNGSQEREWPGSEQEQDPNWCYVCDRTAYWLKGVEDKLIAEGKYIPCTT